MNTAQCARMFERFLERKMRAAPYSVEYEVSERVMIALARGMSVRAINAQIRRFRNDVSAWQNRARTAKNIVSVGQGSRRLWA